MGSMTPKEPVCGIPLTVTTDVIGRYATITNDFNPIHVDPVFAAQSSMGGIIAHGTMSLALIWQILRAEFGVTRCGAANVDIRFTKPVRINDVLTAKVELKEDNAFYVWVENQTGVRVIDGVARL
ncbi:MAG: acyl dehydratase [Rhodobacteraceae bacterium]|nr:acyl dehydratase [Paracoccaceae bacterium]